jgi:hypothetical protein
LVVWIKIRIFIKYNITQMANIKLKSLIIEAEDFQARSKETGKLVHFKSKDSYQAALKAGTHEDPKAKKGEQPKAAAKSNDMFGGDYAKDRGGEAPKADSMATVNSIAAKTGLRAQAVAGWADENGVNLSKVSADIDSKKLKPMDFMTAVSGNPGNKYAKDIIAKYSQSAPKADTSGENQKYDTSGETDYFEEYEQLPDNIKGLMDKHFGSGDDEYDYKELESIQKDFEANGWTFDFDLSGTPFELKPLPQSAPKANTTTKSKYDDKSYWKDVEREKQGQGADDDWDDDDSWGEGPQLTSDRLNKIETALEDELDLRGNGFETTRESGGGMGGWEGPMQIMDKNADFDDEDNYITLSVGSPNNDGKMSIIFANQNGEPYFEPDYDALTGDNDLEPQQAYKITKALMKMPEVQKLLKGEMSKEDFQPIYDKLKAKFSKGKTESTKLTSMIKR